MTGYNTTFSGDCVKNAGTLKCVAQIDPAYPVSSGQIITCGPTVAVHAQNVIVNVTDRFAAECYLLNYAPYWIAFKFKTNTIVLLIDLSY